MFFLAGFWICAIGRWLLIPLRILPLTLAILRIQFSRHAKVSLFYGCFLVGDLKGGATPPCGPSFSLHEHCQKKAADRDRPWQTVTPCKFERKKPNIVGKCRDRPWQTVTDRDSKLVPAAHSYGSPGKTCKMKNCSLEMCFVSTSVLPRTNPLASAVNFRWSKIKQPTLTCPGHAFQVIHLVIQNSEFDCSLWTHKWFRTSSD